MRWPFQKLAGGRSRNRGQAAESSEQPHRLVRPWRSHRGGRSGAPQPSVLVTAPTVSEAETQPPCLDAGTPSPVLRAAGQGPGREGQDNLEDGFGNRKTVP